MRFLRRFYPLAAFFGGFIADALTLGQRVTPLDFWRLGGFLLGAAVFALWLAWRGTRRKEPPVPAADLRGHVARLTWQAPYLLMQFFGSMPFPVEIDFSTNMTLGGTTARH
ncbi:hypothetical protein LOS88_24050 (plasmid) [Aeromonas veronii]|uniref:hypothetical protein n=1 Tax=Aeromonas TaxID=642 RepID=UPI001FD17D1F|nr:MULTISPECIES: hypothetical protein [Aeromonas]MCJ7978279.1 hypothetical protein [Aeromonas veronii]UOR21496.1 hypothetical protein LOS88_24050 [Aeromonas veronii]